MRIAFKLVETSGEGDFSELLNCCLGERFNRRDRIVIDR